MDYYATIECPICNSTSQFKLATITSGPFLCPVCSEGEAEINTFLRKKIHYKNKNLSKNKNPLTGYNASW
jgi:hypothetical protein